MPEEVRGIAEFGYCLEKKRKGVQKSIILHLDLGNKEFSLEACRSIITMVDKDRNGKLDYKEFSDVWRRIMQYRVTFKKYDRDNSGDMNVDELQQSLLTWKIKINSTVLRALISRYANRRGFLSFDDYIQICCRVQSISGNSPSFLLLPNYFAKNLKLLS